MSMLAWGTLLSPPGLQLGGWRRCCPGSLLWPLCWKVPMRTQHVPVKYRSDFLYSFSKIHFYFHFPGTSITVPSDPGIKGNIQTEAAAGRTPASPALLMLLLRSGLYMQIMGLFSASEGCCEAHRKALPRTGGNPHTVSLPHSKELCGCRCDEWSHTQKASLPSHEWMLLVATALSPALIGISWLAGNNFKKRLKFSQGELECPEAECSSVSPDLRSWSVIHHCWGRYSNHS